MTPISFSAFESVSVVMLRMWQRFQQHFKQDVCTAVLQRWIAVLSRAARSHFKEEPAHLLNLHLTALQFTVK